MRLFVGLPVPHDIAEDLTRTARRIAIPRAHWSPPENLHITLYFLGEVREPQLAQLNEALDAVPVRALSVVVRNLGTFPRGGVLFAQVETCPALSGLQAVVASAVARFAARPDPNSPPQGDYQPHITLARTRDKLRPDPAIRSVLNNQLRFQPESLNLYHSRPAPGGSRYEVIHSVALTTAPDAQERLGPAAAS